MSSEYKPQGYTSVAPYLIVDGASQGIDFMVRTFGGVELRRVPAPGGKVMHAEVRVYDTVVMIADAPSEYPVIDAHVHVYVRDVDATYKSALENGGTSVQEPMQKDDPDRRGGVKDVCGTTWWISTQVD